MARNDPTPAIVRDYSMKDAEIDVISKPHDSVSHRKGWGASGYKVQVVKHDCPADHCSFDRMVRRHDVSGERNDEVRYWCLNPNCVHYAADTVSYACKGSYPHRKTDEPAVWESAP